MMRRSALHWTISGLVAAVFCTLVGWGIYQGLGSMQAHTLRDRLLDASSPDVPGIVKEMAPYRRWLDPLLHKAYVQAEKDNERRKQLHASLALLPADASQVKYLKGRLLGAEAAEVGVIRDALLPHKDQLVNELWAVVQAPEKGKESQRLRAAAALAKYDPESEKWPKAQEAVADDLVKVPAVYLGAWLESLRPIRARLRAPVVAIYREVGRRDLERSLATDILADYAADQPQVLADLLMGADDKQFVVIFPKFNEQGDKGLPLLTAVIDTKLPADMPSSDGKQETLAKRQANAAVALLRMNRPGRVWPLLKHRPDPRVRSYLIHRLSPLGADARAIVNQLGVEKDITIRRALLLSLGEFAEKDFASDDRIALLRKLQEIYRAEPDPGLHAAAEWLLRTWKHETWLTRMNDDWTKNMDQRNKRLEDIQKSLAKDKAKASPQWYVNTQGQTFVVIPGPVEFEMGSPKYEKDHFENEVQHKRRIGRTFALACKAVTLAQYRRLADDKYEIDQKWTRQHPDLPVVAVNWYMAARYCILISREEGIGDDQWCYEPNKNGNYDEGMKLKANYLHLTGYRLPTEAEMEYATRAGSVTSRYYGETEDLLVNYAWYFRNSNALHPPVGTKKPNDLGLFDVQGNCWTWCQEPRENYPGAEGDNAVEDQEVKELVVRGTQVRALRGGSFTNPASFVRSANRDNAVPSNRLNIIGFRLARTLQLGSATALPPTAQGVRD
jgi:formylglycine-generating enzyme required for sulfatase activity